MEKIETENEVSAMVVGIRIKSGDKISYGKSGFYKSGVFTYRGIDGKFRTADPGFCIKQIEENETEARILSSNEGSQEAVNRIIEEA